MVGIVIMAVGAGAGIGGGVRCEVTLLRDALGRGALHCSSGDALQCLQPVEQHRPFLAWLPEELTGLSPEDMVCVRTATCAHAS